MDLVGPLSKSGRGHEHILVIVDFATRYPEVVPLRKTSKHRPGARLTLQLSRHSQRDSDGPRHPLQQTINPWEFQPEDQVLDLLPNASCKFLASWQGPYTMTEQVGPVRYLLRQPGRRRAEQIYHVNLLKQWLEPNLPNQLSSLSMMTSLW